MRIAHTPVATEDFDDGDDDVLTAVALAADPDAPIPTDATSLWDLEARDPLSLSDRYMPAPMSGRRRRRGWQRRVAWLVVVAFVLIDADGMGSTYGSIVRA